MGMIDISEKNIVKRRATAGGFLELAPGTLKEIRQGTVRKGDVLAIAEAAALLAVKSTPNMIPHCHPIPLDHAVVEFELAGDGIGCNCTVGADYRTGVEMEALVGVSAALLTIWDMVKYLEKDERGQYPGTAIKDIRVLKKEKGDANEQ